MVDNIKVLIVDQQPLFRQGIRYSLTRTRDIEVMGEASVDEEVLSHIETSPPDVVLLGIDPALSDGLKLCSIIKQHLPTVAVIIFTSYPEDDQLFQAIKAQASAYISKAVTTEELTHTIRQCAHGAHPINEILVNRPKVAEHILQQFQELAREKEIATFTSPLTPRETEILKYMAQGYLNKQIADALTVTEQTVKNHITSILRKLNVNARTQAVIVALKKGLVSISQD